MCDYEKFVQKMDKKNIDIEVDYVTEYIKSKLNVYKIKNLMNYMLAIDKSLTKEDIVNELRIVFWKNEVKYGKLRITTQYIYHALINISSKYNYKDRKSMGNKIKEGGICCIEDIYGEDICIDTILITEILMTFSQQEKLVFELYYMQGYNMREISEQTLLSRDKVNRIITKTSKVVKNIIKNDQ